MKNRQQVRLRSATELRAKKQELLDRGFSHLLLIDTVFFRPDCNLDFFALSVVQNGGKGHYASDRLVGEIRKAGCTGIDFLDVNDGSPFQRNRN